MSNIELVIKIPKKVYKAICDKNALGCNISDIKNIIRNGTPLPKEHGDLIDRDGLVLDCDWSDYYDGFSAYSESQVRLASTIIEAESEVNADEDSD